MSPIARLVMRRLLFGLASLMVLSALIFGVTQALPSDAAAVMLGREATPEALAAIRADLGLDRSVPAQYLSWLGGIATGDAGNSVTGGTVFALVGERVGNSLFLVFLASLASIPLSIFLGAFAALRRDRPFDSISSIFFLVFASMPEFVVGTLLVMAFSTTFAKILPAVSYIRPGEPPWSDLKGFILPVLTLALGVVPYVARVMRSAMVEVLESDYIEMARLKGMSERVVLRRHAFPNAVGPVFQVIALNLAYLAGGVILVEYLFNFFGIGTALSDAVRCTCHGNSRDWSVVPFVSPGTKWLGQAVFWSGGPASVGRQAQIAESFRKNHARGDGCD